MRGPLTAAGLLLAGALLALSVAWSVSGPAVAQDAGLSPALANIKRSHTVRLGQREASPPFSFPDPATRPSGYSPAMCAALHEEIGPQSAQRTSTIDYHKVRARHPI